MSGSNYIYVQLMVISNLTLSLMFIVLLHNALIPIINQCLTNLIATAACAACPAFSMARCLH